MEDLIPIETLWGNRDGELVPLPPRLAALYREFRLPTPNRRPTVIANFVTTLDGVVALEQGGGGPISGFNPADRMVMGILRAVADAVIVGAGTLRPSARHLWTAESVYPPLAEEYRQLRVALGKGAPPLNVIVTGSGELDPAFRVFQSGEVPVLVVTTRRGEARIRALGMPEKVSVVGVNEPGPIPAGTVLEVVAGYSEGNLILLEGGPQLMNDFVAERLIDELYLTLAPQIAGREGEGGRPGLVSGQRFAPDDARWGRLTGVRRAGSHLFLRYGWERGD